MGASGSAFSAISALSSGVGGSSPGVPPDVRDVFTTADPTPVATPRGAEPGPGSMRNTDTENKISISGSKLIISGGKSSPGWNDPAVWWTDGAGGSFARTKQFTLGLTITTTNWAAWGWSNTGGAPIDGMVHGAFLYPDGRLLVRYQLHTGSESVDEVMTVLRANVAYELRSVLMTSGFVFFIRGGHFGSRWRPLAANHQGTGTGLVPAISNYQVAAEYTSLKVERREKLTAVPFAFNGGYQVGGLYRLGIGYWFPKYQAGALLTNNPVLVPLDSTWETHGGSTVLNAPWMLKDGSTWYMWYNSSPTPGVLIGGASSSDSGVTWTRFGGNPTFAAGESGTWNSQGNKFPVVWKDENAHASRRWRAITGGFNGSGDIQMGLWYASAPDGAFTEEAGNPILPLGTGADLDTKRMIPGTLVFDAENDIGYLFYQGTRQSTYPDGGVQMVATFKLSDPVGSFAKLGAAFLPRTSATAALTSNLSAGATSCAVASSSAFEINEIVVLTDTTGKVHQARVVSKTATTITFEPPSIVALATASSAKIESTLQSVIARSVWREGDVWWALTTAYQCGHFTNDAYIESTYLVKGTGPITGWEYQHAESPLFWLPLSGDRPADANYGWIGRVLENPALLRDAVTMEPVQIALTT